MTGKGQQAGSEGESKEGAATSALEWISAATGLVVASGMLGFIAWEAFTGRPSAPPAVSVTVEKVVPTPAGFIVQLKATNHSEATAAAVIVEGELKQGDKSVEKSQATISYVPGYSEREAGVLFRRNPARFRMEVRAVGYEKP